MEKYPHILSPPILSICRRQFRSLIDVRLDLRLFSRSRVGPGTVTVLIFSSLGFISTRRGIPVFQSGFVPADKNYPHRLFRRPKSDLSIIHSCLHVYCCDHIGMTSVSAFLTLKPVTFAVRLAQITAGWTNLRSVCPP